MKYRLILLDFDGTVCADTRAADIHIIQAVYSELQQPMPNILL